MHLYILKELWVMCLLTAGAMQEILHSHSIVILQPDFDKPYFTGMNPYALGFAMMTDIRRVCENPTSEDKEYLPQIAGVGDWRAILKDAWANYRDESFVTQFLSPKVVRDFHLFMVHHGDGEKKLVVKDIHDDEGFRGVRTMLSRAYNVSESDPDIQVTDANFKGDRGLRLLFKSPRNRRLEATEAERTLRLMHRKLWPYPINLDMENSEGKIIPAFSINSEEFKRLA